jgi:uncharacterized membrane protein
MQGNITNQNSNTEVDYAKYLQKKKDYYQGRNYAHAIQKIFLFKSIKVIKHLVAFIDVQTINAEKNLVSEQIVFLNYFLIIH